MLTAGVHGLAFVLDRLDPCIGFAASRSDVGTERQKSHLLLAEAGEMFEWHPSDVQDVVLVRLALPMPQVQEREIL